MNTLVIKLGALGDVIRTTPLLGSLPGRICWATRKGAMPLLPSERLAEIVDIEDCDRLLAERFDLVLSLDDELEAARLASRVRSDVLVGAYLDAGGAVSYTKSSSAWFDMGLLSRFGKAEADRLKRANRRTYQDILFEIALGREFRGEEYLINEEGLSRRPSGAARSIGIEARSGDRWPTKRWDRYEDLARRLRDDGRAVRFLAQRDALADYIRDINECDLIVCGDTLAMHVALALRKSVVALFTCTSPAEIYDYKRLTKVVSPRLDAAYYRRDYVAEAVAAIELEEVLAAVNAAACAPA